PPGRPNTTSTPSASRALNRTCAPVAMTPPRDRSRGASARAGKRKAASWAAGARRRNPAACLGNGNDRRAADRAGGDHLAGIVGGAGRPRLVVNVHKPRWRDLAPPHKTRAAARGYARGPMHLYRALFSFTGPAGGRSRTK